MRRAGLAALAALALSACSGGPAAGRPGGERVEFGGDVFLVERRGSQVTLRNDSQGIADAGRLYRNAEAAAVMATGCDVTRMTQRTGANIFDAGLDCRTGR